MAESKALYLSATKIAIRIGCSAQKVNLLLAELGYQHQAEGASTWSPTELGRPKCRIRKGKDQKGKDYEMLTWHESMVEIFSAYASPTREEFNELRSLIELLNGEIAALKGALNVHVADVF